MGDHETAIIAADPVRAEHEIVINREKFKIALLLVIALCGMIGTTLIIRQAILDTTKYAPYLVKADKREQETHDLLMESVKNQQVMVALAQERREQMRTIQHNQEVMHAELKGYNNLTDIIRSWFDHAYNRPKTMPKGKKQ